MLQPPSRRTVYLIFLMAFSGLVVLLALVMPFASSFTDSPLKEGEVAAHDVRAPYNHVYPSEILTQQQRERAAAAVEPIYSSVDISVARSQLERLRAALAYITTVRSDTVATYEQKLHDLAALEDIQLKKETAQRILDLPNSRWEAVQREAITVLEQVMRNPIRENRLDLARLGVPTAISLYLPEDQASIVTEIVSAFVIPNSLYNKEQTDAERQKARDAAAPIARTFAAGETIVQRGKVITLLDIEALHQFGLLQATYRWQDLVSAATMTLLTLTFFGIYLKRNNWLVDQLTRLTVVTLLFLAFLLSARLIIPGHTVIPYLFPLSAYALLVAALFRSEIALLTALPLTILVTLGLPYSLELSIYYALSSFIGVLVLGQARRITSFFWTGFAIALAGTAVIIAYRLPQPTTDAYGLLTLLASASINGVASAGLALILQFFLAQVLGMTTALQLLELSRPDHPLLQLLLRNAPGTYQHSLQVANLAEQAAERIGADALLTRVGALYHDVGKIKDPIFYIENQIPGTENPHDNLEPSTSAALIIHHIPKGIELSRKYRLPRRIQDFIREHHGSMITRYQYSKAVEAAKKTGSSVDPEDYTYPGPRPQSRETALLMLADGCEARVRAERPRNEEELRTIVKSVIDHSISNGALHDTDLTLSDLDAIVDSFTATLRGVYHPRIQYPKLEQNADKPEQKNSINTNGGNENPKDQNEPALAAKDLSERSPSAQSEPTPSMDLR
jgi:cyclic-di-AMP phosphodiesterase PgpH